MADWVDIDNTTIEPDAPLISSTMFALRDNPKAIAEGAAGAPRVEKESLADYPWGAEDFQSGTAERDWVLARTAAANVGTVGSYAFLYEFGTVSPGSTRSGSSLTYANGSRAQSGSPSGTWRCMGFADRSNTGDPSDRGVTLWLRIS